MLLLNVPWCVLNADILNVNVDGTVTEPVTYELSYANNVEENFRPVPLSAFEYDTGNVYTVGESAAAWINQGRLIALHFRSLFIALLNFWFTLLSLLTFFVGSKANSCLNLQTCTTLLDLRHHRRENPPWATTAQHKFSYSILSSSRGSHSYERTIQVIS